jgi:hypothetical protein
VKKTLSFILLLHIHFFAFSQEESPQVQDEVTEDHKSYKKEYYFLSPRVSVTVPHPMKNKAFRKSFVGIYEVSGGLNLMLYKGLFIGATYKNGLLKITENKIADYNASMSINNIGLKVGGDFFIGDQNKIIFSGAITGGQSYARYSGLVCRNPLETPKTNTYTTTYLEPELNLFFLVEQNFGIGLTISYSIFNTTFNPYDLCLNDWASFDKENPGRTQYFSFGFGFYCSLIKKREKMHGGY